MKKPLNSTTQSHSKGIENMNTTSPEFDLTAARSHHATPAWDPASFLTDYCYTLEQAKASQKPVKYIMGEDGLVYEMRSTDVGDFFVQAKKVTGAAKVKEGFSLNVPKLPFRLLLQAVSFFRDVCTEFNNDEAMLQYWFDKETKEFFADCVQQTTNKVHVTYLRNKELEEDPNKVLVMDIHSHNTMDAFFSGTDDASEQETRTYGVIGRLDQEIPAFKFRISVEGTFKEIAVNQIFEMPKVKIYSDGFESEGELEPSNLFYPSVEYPKEWLDTIEEGKRSKTKFNGKGNHPHGRISRTPSRNSIAGSRDFNLDVLEDMYADARQMSIFSDSEDYPTPAYNNHLASRTSIYRNDTEVEDEITEDVDTEYYVEEFASYLEQVEDPDIRVGSVSAVMRDFSMHEIKMLVDRMIELGYDHEIIDQMRENGYVLKR